MPGRRRTTNTYIEALAAATPAVRAKFQNRPNFINDFLNDEERDRIGISDREDNRIVFLRTKMDMIYLKLPKYSEECGNTKDLTILSAVALANLLKDRPDVFSLYENVVTERYKVVLDTWLEGADYVL